MATAMCIWATTGAGGMHLSAYRNTSERSSVPCYAMPRQAMTRMAHPRARARRLAGWLAGGLTKGRARVTGHGLVGLPV